MEALSGDISTICDGQPAVVGQSSLRLTKHELPRATPWACPNFEPRKRFLMSRATAHVTGRCFALVLIQAERLPRASVARTSAKNSVSHDVCFIWKNRLSKSMGDFFREKRWVSEPVAQSAESAEYVLRRPLLTLFETLMGRTPI